VGFWLFPTCELATAWATTGGVACYAILKRRIQVYKEWMMRAYIVIFDFVAFRLLSITIQPSRLLPENDLSITIARASW
jgi:hypothetical protein